MAFFIANNLAPIMFGSLVIFLLLGYPVAFSLGACGLLYFLIGVELAPLAPKVINLDWPLLQSLPERLYGVMNNDILLAIPFFTFMGLILERSGMAEDLLDTIGQLFGTLRGGLAYAVIFVGALLAATTGVVAASVISMGLISLPIMLRYGYDRRVASGVIAASGTLAQIIPPSLVLIVLADQLGSDVGSMYQGAFVPGLVLSAMYAGYILIVSLISKDATPGLPPEAVGFREDNGSRGLWSLLVLFLVCAAISYVSLHSTTFQGIDFVIISTGVGATASLSLAVINWVVQKFTGYSFLSRMAKQVTFVMVPPLLLIFLVLGTILIGLATPTEGGAMGATGAMILAATKRFVDNNPARFNFDLVRSAVYATAKLSAFVIFILIGARIFSLTFYGVNGHLWVEHHLHSLPGGLYGFLIVVNVAVFLLAFFLDFFELAFIVVPLLKPAVTKIFQTDPQACSIAASFNFTTVDACQMLATTPLPESVGLAMLIWFGIMLAVNMQTSFMHPPFGFALFYLRSVAPHGTYVDRVTGKTMDGVTTGQIYWGAVPFVIIQVIMVAWVMFAPGMVLSKRPERPAIDPAKAMEQLNTIAPPAGNDDLPAIKF